MKHHLSNYYHQQEDKIIQGINEELERLDHKEYGKNRIFVWSILLLGTVGVWVLIFLLIAQLQRGN